MWCSIFTSFFLLLCLFLGPFSRTWTQSTTLRTTGSSTCRISAILTAGDMVYWHLNPTQALYSALAYNDWENNIDSCQTNCSTRRWKQSWLCIPAPWIWHKAMNIRFKCCLICRCWYWHHWAFRGTEIGQEDTNLYLSFLLQSISIWQHYAKCLADVSNPQTSARHLA